MDRYSKQISTGKILECQSGGDDNPDLKEMRLDTLKQNATNSGIAEADIEVGWATPKEIQTWIADNQSPLDNWLNDIRASDSSMIPRWMEDHIESEHSGVAGSPALQKRYDDKVALRATKPKE